MAKSDLGLVFMQNLCLNYYYALPNRVFDFVQAGLPILGSRFPEIAAIVENEKDENGNPLPVGLCIDDTEPDAIARAVRQIMADPDMVAHWRDNVRHLAPRLTWEADSEKLAYQLTIYN